MRVGSLVRWVVLLLALALPLAAWAGGDPDQKKELVKGGGYVIVVRFKLGTEGMGVIWCGSCNTAAGCQHAWCRVGQPLACKATPAAGWKFTHWTADGNFVGTEPYRHFCSKGAHLVAHFTRTK